TADLQIAAAGPEPLQHGEHGPTATAIHELDMAQVEDDLAALAQCGGQLVLELTAGVGVEELCLWHHHGHIPRLFHQQVHSDRLLCCGKPSWIDWKAPRGRLSNENGPAAFRSSDEVVRRCGGEEIWG